MPLHKHHQTAIKAVIALFACGYGIIGLLHIANRSMARPSAPPPGFVRLNDSVHFRNVEPGQGLTRGSNHRIPNLILLLSWGGAPLRLVAKYTDSYAKIFPATPVLLVQTEFIHIIRHTRKSQDVPLAPALSILRDHVHGESHGSHPGRLLVHLFSNGGSYKLIEIAKRYKDSYGQRLPIGTMIVDSAPGISTLVRSFKAISYALPKFWLLRRPLQLLLILWLFMVKLTETFVLGEGLMSIFRREMNDPGLIENHAKRCYIYGPADELVGWQDVKDHAADARKQGYTVTEELFNESAHVAHMRADPERYWMIICQTWESPLPDL